VSEHLTSNVELLMDHAADCEERNGGSCIVSAAIRALIAEVDRLTRKLEAASVTNVAVLLRDSDAQNQRLREALGKLTNGYKYSTEVVTIAREALAGFTQPALPEAGLTQPHETAGSAADPVALLGEFERRCNLIGQAAALLDTGHVKEARDVLALGLGEDRFPTMRAPVETAERRCHFMGFRDPALQCELQEGHDGPHRWQIPVKATGDGP